MQIRYSYLDPETARSSIVLTVTTPAKQARHKDSRIGVRNLHTNTQTSASQTRILVDPGSGVDLDRVSKLVPELDAILLTHAHYDHVETLSAIAGRFPDAPIYASHRTTELLPTLDLLDASPSGQTLTEIQDRCQNPTDWTSLTSDVRLTGVPAGHAPGAIGFYLEADPIDTSEPVSVYVAGDFTRADVASNPGAVPLTADILFLTTSTTDDYAATLTDGLENTLEYATSHERTLVMSTSLLGAQVTQLLGYLIEKSDLGLTIAAGGSVAQTLSTAELNPPHTTLVEEYEPQSLLQQADITVTAPAAPQAEASTTGAATLYDQLKENSMAAIVRFCTRHSTYRESLEQANCLTDSHLVTGHPTEDTLESFIEDVAPGTVVPMHETGTAYTDRRTMWRRVVYAPPSTDPPCTLFGGGQLTLPGPLSQKESRALNIPTDRATTRRKRSPDDCTYVPRECVDWEKEAITPSQMKARFDPTQTGTRSPQNAKRTATTSPSGDTGGKTTPDTNDRSPTPSSQPSPQPPSPGPHGSETASQESPDPADPQPQSQTQSQSQSHAKYCTDSKNPLVTDGSTETTATHQATHQSPEDTPTADAESASATLDEEDHSVTPTHIHAEIETITTALDDLQQAAAEHRDQTIETSDMTTTRGMIKQTLDDRLVVQLDLDPASLSDTSQNPADISSGDDIVVHLQGAEESSD